MDTPKYFAYMALASSKKDNFIKMLTEPPHEHSSEDCGWGFKSPRQSEPYGVDLKITYEVRPGSELEDALLSYGSFDIYSEKILDILKNFGVKLEAFEITLLDKKGNKIDSPKYYIVHILEGLIDGMDEQKSHWEGTGNDPDSRIVLDYSKFEHRPIFVLDKAYKKLIREDLKNEFQKQEVKGLAYLPLEEVRNGILNFDQYRSDI